MINSIIMVASQDVIKWSVHNIASLNDPYPSSPIKRAWDASDEWGLVQAQAFLDQASQGLLLSLRHLVFCLTVSRGLGH